MTRYMITFRSVGEQKRTKKVPQQVGEEIVRQVQQNKNIVINGDWYNVADIESVRKITKENGFDKDFVALQEKSELRNEKERLYLQNLPQLKNGN